MFSLEVDTYWATVFRCSTDDLWRPGIVVSPHAEHLTGYRGVFLFSRRDACRVSARPDLVEPLKSFLQGRDVPDVSCGGTFVELFGDQVDQVIGPNWYGYVSRGRYRRAAKRRCREIAADDAYSLDALRDACGLSDWAEASFDRVPALSAASKTTTWSRRAT